MNNVQILVLDFGSQYTQLIARRLRECGVYTEIAPYFETLDSIKAKKPKGIILSGGPASIYEKDAYKPDSRIFDLNIPILGICYGMQYIADFFGGKVIRAEAQEFGKAVLELLDNAQGSDLCFTTMKKNDIDLVIKLWEKSVLATHHFLSKDDIKDIKKDVISACNQVEHIILARYDNNIVGFIGVQNNHIEMLFVSPSMFNKGIGKALLKEAYMRVLKDNPTISLDCNEQNTKALSFYTKLGFKRIGRSEKDPSGRDYPIIHFEITNKQFFDAINLKSKAITSFKDISDARVIMYTKRTYLRELKSSDLDALHSILNDSNVMWSWGGGFSKEESLKWLNTQLARYKEFGFGFWAVIDKESGELVGNVGLNYENIKMYDNGEILRDRILEIGYIIKHSYWNKGYAFECALACREYANKELNIKNVYCLIRDDNFKSMKIARKLGMNIVGENIKLSDDNLDSISTIEHTELIFKSNINLDSNCIKQNIHSGLFRGVSDNSIVWMSHCDRVERIPDGFIELAKSDNTNYCAIANLNKQIYALQFHPEVVHSEFGSKILSNFAIDICKADNNWNMKNFLESEITRLREIVFNNSMHLDSNKIDSISNLDSKVRCDWAKESEQAYLDYHDNEWGIPLHDDNKLFEYLILEGFQAGLSWLTILKKRENFREAFDYFNPELIALYNEEKINSLMSNKGIVRNLAKIKATINNAKRFIEIQKEFGSFDSFIWKYVGYTPIINTFNNPKELPSRSDLSDRISKDLMDYGFKFVGSTIIYAFMQAIGMVNDHMSYCYKNHMKTKDILDSNKPNKVLCAVSGGVDSSVVATLLHRAIGDNLIAVFVDTGLLRKGEREAVEHMFKENLNIPLIVVDASSLFLDKLKGVINPESKRKIIGETFIEVFENEARRYKDSIKCLAQGTLYPDIIESISIKGPSKTIKSHHNVGGLPKWMKFELIEPLRELFKDEVRALGYELNILESMLMRHPFPGPGLAIRIIGEVNKRGLDLLRKADFILIDELHKNGLYNKVWQAFCVLLNVNSVGVMGDNRTYENTICIRAVESIDGMTANFSNLPISLLESISNRIINEVDGINRVVYDITSKPPGTIEWE